MISTSELGNDLGSQKIPQINLGPGWGLVRRDLGRALKALHSPPNALAFRTPYSRVPYLMMHSPIHFDWKMRETPQYRMMRMGSLMIKTIKTPMRVGFRAIPRHRITRYEPLVLELNQGSQHSRDRGIFYISFLTWKWQNYQGQK